MRRIVIVCLLLLLPLQWSWAAVHGGGQQECGCVSSHEGADIDDHAAPDHRGGDCCGGAAGAPCGAHCADCGGQPLTGLLGATTLPLACPGHSSASDPAQPFRNHIPDHPLRPPCGKLA